MRPRADASGEGSRGGKIIGHTSSGKPIYMNHNHPSHGNFTKEEHGQAAVKHRDQYRKTPSSKRTTEQWKHVEAFEHHQKLGAH